ncbi:sigma-54-dependent transcriptional regulator [Halochromatium salexigens]|uniref:Sigma-54-dependent Fis family transcriptional regulator n=1 Tax=Halochromatium salexigens TaxID=49447 RepID=A0AAJ0UFT7_HALSE|nr:sigma-54 dependent transcriptional regulator [Halochromatium salexigens]MBK5930531.1 sigma-54-dependent Fis family transcriptional regulator [Halochromatium salexigens]
MSSRLLIIEDDAALAEMLTMHFEDNGLAVARSDGIQTGLSQARAAPPDLVLLDQQLPDGRGCDLIAALLELDAELPILMMTGKHDLELAIDAIQQGAADFVHKPIEIDDLQARVEHLLAQRHAANVANTAASSQAAEPLEVAAGRDLIGRSQAMLTVSKAIALSARSAASMLISGESGTGKEVVAHLIHQHSGRTGPFVAVNCAAIVDTLLESELFGHEKGAFTGAQARKQGRFEQAEDGTLFLDEIGELAPPLQAKLLRALQERVFERVGGTESITTNARVIAATNRDLLAEAEAEAGRFREDLVYRLKVIEIRVPPLRERCEDIPLLVEGLLKRIAERLGQARPRITDAALRELATYDWPGNVRELENLLTQAVLHARHALITPDLLPLGAARPTEAHATGASPAETAGAHLAASPLQTLAEIEAAHIQRVLDHTQGHKGRSCEVLAISRPALDRKITKYGLRVPARAS